MLTVGRCKAAGEDTSKLEGAKRGPFQAPKSPEARGSAATTCVDAATTGRADLLPAASSHWLHGTQNHLKPISASRPLSTLPSMPKHIAPTPEGDLAQLHPRGSLVSRQEAGGVVSLTNGTQMNLMLPRTALQVLAVPSARCSWAPGMQ